MRAGVEGSGMADAASDNPLSAQDRIGGGIDLNDPARRVESLKDGQKAR